MKNLPGASHPCPALKWLSNKLGVMFCFHTSQHKYARVDSKLERKMIEIKRSTAEESNFRSINSIIMKFPKFREGLQEVRVVFQQFDEDCNGTIDREELKKCLQKLHLNATEEEIDDLFCACDIDENEGIQLNELMVLLCLTYFLMDFSASSRDTSELLSRELQATFNTIIEAFLFLDKNGDGKLHKKDVVKALNEDASWEKSPSHVTRTRFKELDWYRKGKVGFREFLFAFISWVGLDFDDQNPETECEAKSQGACMNAGKQSEEGQIS